jgi:hypothetical protein
MACIKANGATVRPLALTDLTLREFMAFAAGSWRFDGLVGDRVRWQDAEGYFAVYERTRPGFMSRRHPWPTFAEHARELWRAGNRDPWDAARAAYEADIDAYRGRR